MTYGYLRVSSDRQDVESQKIGVVKKAAELQLEIGEWIKDEGVSGIKDYNKRHLGELMKKAQPGDVIIVSEISRLARSVFMLFRIIEFCTENNIIIYSVKDSINTIKKGDLTGIMMVFCFGIAAQIEREMIVKRTVEGIERRRRDGVLMGRPPGSSGKRILDGKEELIKEYLSVGLNTSQIARLLDVDRMTVNKYCKEKNIAVNASKEWTFRENETHKQGAKTDALLNPEKEYILSLAEEGLSNKYVVEKLDTEKGIKVGDRSFGRWLRADPEFYELFVEKYMQARAVRNKDCGKQKQYYKF